MALRVGFIGSGFNTRFHIQGWRGVRESAVCGIWSPNAVRASEAATLARQLDVGHATVALQLAKNLTVDGIECAYHAAHRIKIPSWIATG